LRTFAPTTAAMTDDTIPLFAFPAIEGKKVTAAFDGGRLSSDGGVMLLSMAERRLGWPNGWRAAFPIGAIPRASRTRSPT
jgi:hypothetical protein